MNKNKFAIVYDVDGTLIRNYASGACLYGPLGVNDNNLWDSLIEKSKQQEVEPNLMLAYEGYKLVREKLPKDKNLMDFIKENINKAQCFEGLDTWFDNINDLGKNLGITIEHYVISAGELHVIQQLPFAKYMKHIFATKFFLDEAGIPVAPSVYISATSKTESLYRISKGLLNPADVEQIFKKMDKDTRSINFKNIIYIGDGETDVPCMKVTKNKGGHSIAVYYDENKKQRESLPLLEEGRVNFIAPTDYRKGSELYNYIENILKGNTR